ncbi:hypothetical protein OJ996_25870 [Luteolibacter sp. GHJ8]|uniref:Tetratricopeptide repeat protein n=1 Tax=Luteolibacter rhizosphaerae TaxID=2989719 RepID=A0ABT3GB20_9BACT|nr:hypothetical protein [Luteolibacter rhizosphaerae]MCW1917044.1 hypothetical protein [Luteolibacter rhizosphaerae]
MVTLKEAEGFAELGLWQDAWDTIDKLPADERMKPAALRLRLVICPYLEAWGPGAAVAKLLCGGDETDRKTAGCYYRDLAKLYIAHGEIDSARVALRDCVEAWPEVRPELLDDPVIARLL